MKQLLAAIVAITALTTPVLAQSFDPDTGTGNVLQFPHNPGTSRADRMAIRQSGLSAYAMGAGGKATAPNAQAATGGGSAGYNEMLRQY